MTVVRIGERLDPRHGLVTDIAPRGVMMQPLISWCYWNSNQTPHTSPTPFASPQMVDKHKVEPLPFTKDWEVSPRRSGR